MKHNLVEWRKLSGLEEGWPRDDDYAPWPNANPVDASERLLTYNAAKAMVNAIKRRARRYGVNFIEDENRGMRYIRLVDASEPKAGFIILRYGGESSRLALFSTPKLLHLFGKDFQAYAKKTETHSSGRGVTYFLEAASVEQILSEALAEESSTVGVNC